MNDKVNHPKHYTSHPSGVECIQITEHYDFCIGNAIKYLWRAGIKNEDGYKGSEKEIEDLRKAIFYINRHIAGLQKGIKEVPLTNKQRVDLLNTILPNTGVAGPATTPAPTVYAWAQDREASARARISNVISKASEELRKSWLDCND